MKTDKVVSFDKLRFKIFSLGCKSGKVLPQFIKNQQNYNLSDKRTTKKPQDVFTQKERSNLIILTPKIEKGFSSASLSCYMTNIVMLYTRICTKLQYNN